MNENLNLGRVATTQMARFLVKFPPVSAASFLRPANVSLRKYIDHNKRFRF